LKQASDRLYLGEPLPDTGSGRRGARRKPYDFTGIIGPLIANPVGAIMVFEKSVITSLISYEVQDEETGNHANG
jgi:hypothetical protein